MGQTVDHWETAIYHDQLWKYRLGTNPPPTEWNSLNFDDSNWLTGLGGIGYGDNDDNTIITNTVSVYSRISFHIADSSKIDMAVFHADYDDAFVAYLNGNEISRSNIGEKGTEPNYQQNADEPHEAQMYQGGLPETFRIDKQIIKDHLKEGENVLAIQVHNYYLTSSDLSGNFFLSFGINDESSQFGPVPDWFDEVGFSSKLPLIILETTETNEIYDEPKVPAHMGIIDNGPAEMNHVLDGFNAYDGQIAIEIRGSSSQSFPKKNYGFETQLASGENNNVSLLGMPKENDWVLHGPYSDKSLLRNVLAYHLGAKTDQYTPRTRLVELIINNDYRGVYVLTERIKIDKNRVDISKLKPEDIDGDELTGGYVVQIDRDGPPIDDGWVSSYPDWKFFAFDDPDYDELMPEQANYIQSYFDTFEADMYSSSYWSKYLEYVDVDSWVDYFLVTETGKHIDAFKLSFFMHKKKDSKGGKIHFGPLWDFNLGFGNFDFVCSPDPEGWSYEFRGTCDNWHPFWVRRLADIPQVSHQTNCRWFELRQGPFHTDSLMQFIDDNVAFLSEASDRNFDRWPVLGNYVWPNDYVGQTYEDEITFLKNWLQDRLDWMDANMIGDCALFTENDRIADNNQAHLIYPNPTSRHLFIDLTASSFESVKLLIFDVLGVQLKSIELHEGLNRIDMIGLAGGIFSYQLYEEDRILATGKVLYIPRKGD